MGNVKGGLFLNNHPENNNDSNIDDILQILQKRKEAEEKKNKNIDDAPTRLTPTIPVPSKAAYDEAKEIQNSIFDQENETDNKESKDKQASFSTTEIDILPIKKAASDKPAGSSVSPAENKAVKDTANKENKPSVGNTPAVSTASGGGAKPVPKAPSATGSKPKPKASADSDKTPKVSLSDFDNAPSKGKKAQEKQKKGKFYLPGYVKVILYLLIVISISLFISFSVIYVGNDMLALDKEDKEIVVNIPEDATLEQVAEELYNKGVIDYPSIYEKYIAYRSDDEHVMDGKFIAGRHVLNSNMNYEQILKILSVPTSSSEIVKVTIPEGFTALEILNLLESKKVINKESRPKLEAKLNTTENLDYRFLDKLPEKVDGTDKKFLLEGYLFPDTYEFYAGENVDSILRKFLNNFNLKFENEFYTRCNELGITVDEAITLASIVQAEGNNSQDFYLISNALNNRLKNPSGFPKLESDATTSYVFKGVKKASELTAEEIKNTDTPYNTYKNNGLPPGAICNPGHDAIHAALYPAEFITEVDEYGEVISQKPVKYYYFYTASTNGKTYFSANDTQHNKYIDADKKGNAEELERLRKQYN